MTTFQILYIVAVITLAVVVAIALFPGNDSDAWRVQ